MKMRVYQFMTAKHGLLAITNRRLKISRIHELNDPFEFLGVDMSDPDFRLAIRRTKKQLSQDHGLLCFSKDWRSPVLWAHYAGKHTGMCLGFDMPQKHLEKVTYINERLPKPNVPDKAFVRKLLFTKFAHWSYETEYRSYLSIDTPIDNLYYKDFADELVLRQVLVGDQSSVTRSQVHDALGEYSSKVESFKVRPAFRSFRIVRQNQESLWA